MNLKKLLAVALLALTPAVVIAQSAIIRGEASPGVYTNLSTYTNFSLAGNLAVDVVGADPCQASHFPKSQAVVNITTATTTSLVSPSASTVVYVCSFNLTISQVITTANTLKFVRGTGGTCGTGTADLTGTFGAGGVTAAAPIVVWMGYGGTIFKTNAADGLCATTTIGGSANFSGVVTYVQL